MDDLVEGGEVSASLPPSSKKPAFVDGETPGHVFFCCPTIDEPFDVWTKAFKASLPLFAKAGWTANVDIRPQCAYISYSRAEMLRRALDDKADVIVFLDHDLSWNPEDLLTLVQTQGPVIAGTYRYKNNDEIKYMAKLETEPGTMRPIRRVSDGCIKARAVPAGFLKVTRMAVNHFIRCYPELKFGEEHAPFIDLFNHGAADGIWYGEDYGFSRHWRMAGGELWIRPELNIWHWRKAMTADPRNPKHKTVEKDSQGNDVEVPHPGNFLEYMLRQPGGSMEGEPYPEIVSIHDYFASAA